MSRIVVDNVQVLTAGTRYDQEERTKDGKPIRTTVVTLAATPANAERIAWPPPKARSSWRSGIRSMSFR